MIETVLENWFREQHPALLNDSLMREEREWLGRAHGRDWGWRKIQLVHRDTGRRWRVVQMLNCIEIADVVGCCCLSSKTARAAACLAEGAIVNVDF